MSEEWRRKQEEEREEEEDIDETAYIAQKDAILFLIDISPTMIKQPPPSDSKNADKDSPAAAALKCAYQIMQQRIISNPRDMMGILLFGTEQSKFQEEDANGRGNLSYPNCYLLTDLDVPSASDVKSIKNIVEDEEEAAKVFVPTEDTVMMSNVLFCANQIFTTKAPSFGSRRLFIITDRDNPHSKDESMRTAATTRAKDLYDLGVVIELFPIARPGQEFDRTIFYDDIVYRDPNDPDAAITGSSSANTVISGGTGIPLLQSLISNINSKQTPKRALFSNLPFEIGPGLKISVKGYNILQQQKPARSCYVWLDGEKAQIAIGETTKMAEDTARTVQSSELKKAYKFGGEQVLFTPEEQKELKNFGAPVLRIIGFKPQSMLPMWASIRKSTFIFPSEEDYIGSTRVFAALWQKLLHDEKVAICWCIPRSNAKPEVVALIPSAERLDEVTKLQIIPAGLWVYPLPFADDIRHPPELPTPLVSPDNLVDQMRTIVQQLQLPGGRYDPGRFPNPALQWHYKILQAIALEEEVPEFKESDDKTVPKYKQIDKRVGPYVVDWGTTLEQECKASAKQSSNFEPTQKTIKREAPDSSSGVAAKKPKAAGAKSESSGKLSGMSDSDLKKLVRSGKLESMTVAILTEFLAAKGLSTSGKKVDLIARAEEHVEAL